MSDLPERIARRIKSLRIARGWSLQQVANLAGLTKSHVWELEQGRSRNPTVQALQGFATAFGVPLAEIIGDATDKPRVPAHLAEAISAVRVMWDQAYRAGYEAALRDMGRATEAAE